MASHTPGPTEENPALVLAAPDLLGTCKAVLEWIAHGAPHAMPTMFSLMSKLEAAIAKAERVAPTLQEKAPEPCVECREVDKLVLCGSCLKDLRGEYEEAVKDQTDLRSRLRSIRSAILD